MADTRPPLEEWIVQAARGNKGGFMEPEAIQAVEAMAYAIQLEQEIKEMQELFDLQHTRSREADKLWQEATGKHDTLPDLGRLLEWLINRGEEARKLLMRVMDIATGNGWEESRGELYRDIKAVIEKP